MKRDYGKYIFSVGLILLLIQFLVIIFNIINGTTNAEVLFAVEEKLTFLGFVSKCWASMISVVLLIVLYIRRLTKGPEPLLMLAGALLWIVQIIGLYESGADVLMFAFKYIIGIFGTLLIAITGIYDAYRMKQNEIPDDDDM